MYDITYEYRTRTCDGGILVCENALDVNHFPPPRRSCPLFLNLANSVLHGSQMPPYFLRRPVSSSRCSRCFMRIDIIDEFPGDLEKN